jgi:hypothetical protein
MLQVQPEERPQMSIHAPSGAAERCTRPATRAWAVEAALRAAGLEPGRQDKTAGLSDIFPGMGDGLAEWSVTAPGRGQMILQMAYFDRARSPVIMDIGPVLDLEDVVGGKVCALASRAAGVARLRRQFAGWPRFAPERPLSPGAEREAGQ